MLKHSLLNGRTLFKKIALFMSFNKKTCCIFSPDYKLSNRFIFPFPHYFLPLLIILPLSSD